MFVLTILFPVLREMLFFIKKTELISFLSECLLLLGIILILMFALVIYWYVSFIIDWTETLQQFVEIISTVASCRM